MKKHKLLFHLNQDMEQLYDDWPRIRKEISDLKAENNKLKERLRNSKIVIGRAVSAPTSSYANTSLCGLRVLVETDRICR